MVAQRGEGKEGDDILSGKERIADAIRQ